MLFRLYKNSAMIAVNEREAWAHGSSLRVIRPCNSNESSSDTDVIPTGADEREKREKSGTALTQKAGMKPKN